MSSGRRESIESTGHPVQLTGENVLSEIGESAPQSVSPSQLSLQVSSMISDDEHVVINDKVVKRSELMPPFAGTFNPGLKPWPKHEFGNAAAIGLAAFSLTAFVLALYLANAMGIENISVVVGLSVFYGGAVQFLAGVWELAIGNTFSGTAFTSFGAFWLSFAAIYIPAFDIVSSYGDDVEQLNNALGIYLIGWGIFSSMLTLVTVKSTIPFVVLFVTLDFSFFILGAGFMTGSNRCVRGGGCSLAISAFAGWYSCFSGQATSKNSYIKWPAGTLPIKHRFRKKIPA
ncbi:unnamed protein product [Candida verbasci]|uniref:Uncharacterized protein n=1 Tax=Candida verbasci TaxID=1227364 RepID=A0A9W4XNL7_9ASCO|nr:unnamed protein product [Candida verbasci]